MREVALLHHPVENVDARLLERTAGVGVLVAGCVGAVREDDVRLRPERLQRLE